MKSSLQRFFDSAAQRVQRIFSHRALKNSASSDAPCALAICLIFKNEADYLKEWLDYHLVVGVEKFFLFNNNSTDHFREVLTPYIDAGIVVLRDYPRRKAQIRAYNICLRDYGASARWIAFIDADEFLCPTDAASVVDVLRNFEGQAAVALNWLMFSSSGHILKPDGLVIENFTKCQAGGNRHVRLIVNPAKTQRFITAHEAVFHERAQAINVSGKPVSGPHSIPPVISTLRVNHYWTRSVEEYFIKKLGRGDVNGITELRDIHGLICAERSYSDATDYAIFRFHDEVKQYQPAMAQRIDKQAAIRLSTIKSTPQKAIKKRGFVWG